MEEQFEKWMDSMGVFLPPEDVKRLLSNEKMKNILKSLTTRIVPYERKKHAERLLLLNSIQTNSRTTIHNVTNNSKRLDLIKRHIKLKTHLKEKEQELMEKKKTYSELVKNIQTLVQDVQLANSSVDEERKRAHIMFLNKLELQSLLNHWNTLQEVVSGIKEIQNLKWKKEKERESLNVEIMDVLNNCQSHIATVYAEVNKESDSFFELKSKMMKYIITHLQGFSWQDIFEGLIKQQQKLNVTIEDLCKNVSLCCPSSEREEVSQISQNTCSYRDYGSILTYQLYMRMLEIRVEGEIECEVLANLPLKYPDMEEELKLIESNICDTDKLIQERTEEFTNMKAPLRKQMNEVCKIMSQIKQFPKELEESVKKCNFSVTLVNELHVCMKQLTATALSEMKLFSEIPLVFLEKLHLLRNKNNEGHKIMFNFQKIYPYIQQFSKTSLNVLYGSSSLTSYEVVLHLFQQLSYLGALGKTESMLKSISEEHNFNFPFNANSCSEVNEKLQIMVKNFVSAASLLDFNLDDIATVTQIWWSHPLKGIVPKDLVVEDTTLEYWVNKFFC